MRSCFNYRSKIDRSPKEITSCNYAKDFFIKYNKFIKKIGQNK